MAATRDLLMEPTLAAGHDDLRGLRLDLFAAQPRSTCVWRIPRRGSAGRRAPLAWREGCAADELSAQSPFERAGKAAGRPVPIYALRLGNHRYPHMKLQVQPWPNRAGFMLSVNSHDQVSGLDSGAADAAAFREIQAENQRLKEAIEEAWDSAGLPTFLRYLRDYIKSRGGESSPSGLDEETDDQAGSITSL